MVIQNCLRVTFPKERSLTTYTGESPEKKNKTIIMLIEAEGTEIEQRKEK